MKVLFNVVGRMNQPRNHYVEMDVPPRIGESVSIPNIPEYDTNVHQVVWYPFGNEEEDQHQKEPFVYVFLGPARS
jgi:hypothetical protein